MTVGNPVSVQMTESELMRVVEEDPMLKTASGTILFMDQVVKIDPVA